MSTTQACELDRIFEKQLQVMAAILRPGTIKYYRTQANRFLRYLHLNHPDLQTPAQLERNPHILGWLRSLAEEDPPLANRSRLAALICIRRLLYDLADNGYPIAHGLILSQDLPPRDRYLPKPLSPEVDTLLDHELRQTDDILANALLLMRATGIRIGEALRLNRDSMRHLGENQWALHVPLGKLHNERWVPIDQDARKTFERILSLAGPTATDPANPTSLTLLLLPNGKSLYYGKIHQALQDAAKRAGCPAVRPHQLRHTFATAMLRAGMSLPALKEILGHRDIRMTMVYVQVTQKDLQREYHQARQRMAHLHTVPTLPNTRDEAATVGIQAICSAVDAVRHQLEMYRRQVGNDKVERRLASLGRRLAKLRAALTALLSP
ncbi:MAG: tyrosine-type recombinase/integrase [Deltaproteobacteria bacterium]|nr:tyrosine-type recombinase/integrase [Deltaproteobacteria bacterium]